ncbi:phosphotransferase [Pontivivens ytuae]|uniref:Phosphotransferase n=1 Tax=Pontivivens ytuae TaxID=2789856 RepID=A0A7S9QBV5_9RHOB|nr:phosphotransferase [Pontivivens ytuae]QPH53165.1 phosphotransferase [Pontivivens ytuae]
MKHLIDGLRGRATMRRLARTLAENDELSGLTAPRFIRNRSGKLTFEATLDGHPVLVQRFTREDPPTVARNVHEAYRKLREVMGDGAFTVPTPIAVVPEEGTVVTERVDGIPVRAMLREDPAAAADGLRRSGMWLARLHAAFPPYVRPVDIGKQAENLLGAPLRSRNAELRTFAQETLRTARGWGVRSLPLVKFHKDFAPDNVVLGLEQTWAVDLTNTKRRLAALDLSHFLVAATRQTGPIEGPRDAGGVPLLLSEPFLEGYAAGQDTEMRELAALFTRCWLAQKIGRGIVHSGFAKIAGNVAQYQELLARRERNAA